MTAESARSATAAQPVARSVLSSVLLGFTASAVVRQGRWPGWRPPGPKFCSSTTTVNGGAPSSWISIQSQGGDIAIGPALLATIVAVGKLRERKDLWMGSAAPTVLLIVEAYIGALIVDASNDTLTALHIPLAIAVMALVVWLPLIARAGRTAS